MTPETLDRRLGTLNWMAFAALVGYVVVFVLGALEDAPVWALAAVLVLGVFGIVGMTAALNHAQAWADAQRAATADLERERARVSDAHARRIVRDGAYRELTRPTPGGGTCVPVARGDGADWILGRADEAGEPVAVVAERGGEFAVYHLKRVV